MGEFLNDFPTVTREQVLGVLELMRAESSLSMKLLLECAPKRLRNDFPGHEIWTVEEVGLKGLKKVNYYAPPLN